MWTIEDLTGQKCSKYQFYSQFVNEDVLKIVEDNLNIEHCEKLYRRDGHLDMFNTTIERKKLWSKFSSLAHVQDTAVLAGLPGLSFTTTLGIAHAAIQDLFPTKVLFRWWKDTVLAMFIEEPGTMDASTCDSYQHIGQHGACSIAIINESRPATWDEYASLKRELESEPYKYRLKVLQKTPNGAMDARRQKIYRVAADVIHNS